MKKTLSPISRGNTNRSLISRENTQRNLMQKEAQIRNVGILTPDVAKSVEITKKEPIFVEKNNLVDYHMLFRRQKGGNEDPAYTSQEPEEEKLLD